MKPRLLKIYNFNTEDSIHHSVYVYGKSLWAFYYKKHFGWLQFFGKGFAWKNTRIHQLSFSQRNRYSKIYKIGRWCFYALPKNIL